MSCTKFLGDAFPHVRPNFGPGVMAAFMGARLENGEHTSWLFPSAVLEIDRLNFKFIEQHIWFNHIQAIIKKSHDQWQGLVQIGMTDLGGNLDILSTFRPSEHLLLDLYDHPDQVKRLTWEAHQTWWTYFEKFNALQKPLNPGYICWAPIFSELPYYMLQCDFSYMISPEIFAEFVVPELIASADRPGNAFYHFDGPGELPHLDEKIICEWGGWIHLCGKAHQWWKRQLDIAGLRGINPYQGEFYDRYEMFEICEAVRIPIVQWTTPVDEPCQERIRTGFSRIIQAKDFDHARRIQDQLYETGHADIVEIEILAKAQSLRKD